MDSSISKGQFAGLVELAEVDSTNKELLRRLDSDTPEFFAVTADKQTAGLGRLGRNWVTEAGKSLAVSILLRPKSRSQTDWITIMAGLALSSALEKHGLIVSLKWPNDLLVEGQKTFWNLGRDGRSKYGGSRHWNQHQASRALTGHRNFAPRAWAKIEKDELLEVIATELKAIGLGSRLTPRQPSLNFRRNS